MPIGNRISDRASCCLFGKRTDITKSICVRRRWRWWEIGIGKRSLSPPPPRSASTGTPVDQNGIITTLFPPSGNDAFPDWGNTGLRLEQETGKHLLFHSYYDTFMRHKNSPCHQTFLYLAREWNLADHNCKNTLFIYTSSKKTTKKNTIENVSKNIQWNITAE